MPKFQTTFDNNVYTIEGERIEGTPYAELSDGSIVDIYWILHDKGKMVSDDDVIWRGVFRQHLANEVIPSLLQSFRDSHNSSPIRSFGQIDKLIEEAVLNMERVE